MTVSFSPGKIHTYFQNLTESPFLFTEKPRKKFNFKLKDVSTLGYFRKKDQKMTKND